VLRKKFAAHLRYSDLACNCLGCVAVVSRQHYRLNAKSPQLSNCLTAVRAYCIGDGKDGERLPVTDENDGGFALFFQGVQL